MNCLICHKSIQTKVPYPSKNAKEKEFFEEIAYCEDCNYGFALPYRSQEELSKIYTDGSYWDDVPTTPEFFKYQVSQCKHRIERVLKYVNFQNKKTLKVLDIGSGNCPLGEALKKQPWDLILQYDFLEPDLSKGPKPNTPKNFSQNRLLSLDGEEKYDIIFLNHVLEHVASPKDFLLELKNKLSQSGILYVETPYLDHLHKEEVFPHCHFFSEEAVKTINQQAGLQTISSSKFGIKVSTVSLFDKINLKVLSLLSKSNFDGIYNRVANRTYGFKNEEEGNQWVYWITKPKRINLND